MKRKLRFVPDRVLQYDFRKWAKKEGYEIPREDSDDYSGSYITNEMTAEDLREVFAAGFNAGERRQERGGVGCGD